MLELQIYSDGKVIQNNPIDSLEKGSIAVREQTENCGHGECERRRYMIATDGRPTHEFDFNAMDFVPLD